MSELASARGRTGGERDAGDGGVVLRSGTGAGEYGMYI